MRRTISTFSCDIARAVSRSARQRFLSLRATPVREPAGECTERQAKLRR